MREWLMQAGAWWVGTAAAGGLVLLGACLLMRLTRQPAARQRLGELAVIAALLVAVLRLGPAWLQVSLPVAEAPPADHAAAPAAQTAAPPVEVAAVPHGV